MDIKKFSLNSRHKTYKSKNDDKSSFKLPKAMIGL